MRDVAGAQAFGSDNCTLLFAGSVHSEKFTNTKLKFWNKL